MPQKLKAGTVNDFTDSMAEAIELAFQKEWEAFTDTSIAGIGQRERRIIFSAIAQGVLKHLRDYAAQSITFRAYVAKEDSSDAHYHMIRSRNKNPIYLGGYWTIPAGRIDVEQYQDDGGDVHKVEIASIEIDDLV